MVRKFSKRVAITFVAAIVTLIVLLCIYPFKLIRTHKTIKSDEVVEQVSEPITVERNVTQIFDGIEGQLKSVELYMISDSPDETITFRMYDQSHEQVFELFYTVPYDFVAPDFITIPIRYDMEEGEEYSFIVEGYTAEIYLAYEDRMTTTSPVNYLMAYAGEEVSDYDLIVRYNYAVPFKLWQIIASIIVLVGICAGLWFGLGTVEDTKGIKLRTVVQWVVNPLIALVAVISTYYVMIVKLFGPEVSNNVFVLLGIYLMLGAIALYVNWSDIGIPADIVDRIESISIGRIVRVISIAVLLWYCYEYMNGLFDISHAYSVVQVFTAFSVLLISTYSRKEVLFIPNAIWLVLGPILGFVVYKYQPGLAVYEELYLEEEIVELYRLYGWLIAIGGFVVINVISNILLIAAGKRRLAKLDAWYAVPFTIFAIGLVGLSHGRSWTWQLVLICVLLTFRLRIVKKNVRDTFLQDVCSGIILNFYMMVWFSLRHRPYYFYQFYRYYMGYHTVTITGYYLSLVMTATVMKLYAAYKKACERYMEPGDTMKSIRKAKRNNRRVFATMIPYMFTFGMSATYIIFTMSRTAFLAVGTMGLFTIFAFSILYTKRDRIKVAVRFIGIIAIAAIYMFPVTYFMTDIIPRLANDPITFGYEYRAFTFYKGMPYESEYYMTIEQFCSEFGKKVFGMDSESDEQAFIRFENPFVLKAYAAETDSKSEFDIDIYEMANGRFDIYKSYIAVWNLWGHDTMGAPLPNGEIAIHAHNSFLQVAHDNGIVFGLYFLLFIGYVILLSLVRAFMNRKDIYLMFRSMVLVCFCMASLVEWTMHTCNPFGLSLFLVIMPLIIKGNNSEKSV